MTILISSCDEYSDTWHAQTALMNRYWGNRHCRTILLTDTNKNGFVLPGIEIIEAGEGARIIERMRKAMEEIKTEYVFFTLDDFMLRDFVKNDIITSHIEKMDNEEISYMRCFLRPKPKRKNKIKGSKGFYNCDLNKNYQVNLSPSIWKKEFLEKTLLIDIDNIWHYEVILPVIAKESNAKCLISLHGEYPFIDTIKKGKFIRKGYRFLKKEGLYNGKRKVNTRMREIGLAIKTNFMRHSPRFAQTIVRTIAHKRGKMVFSDYRTEFENRNKNDGQQNT